MAVTKQIFCAKITERTLLSQTGSTKKTYHLALDLSRANSAYKVGDALAIFPTNPPELVAKALRALQASGREMIVDPKSARTMPLEQFFLEKTDLTRILPSFRKQVAEKSPCSVEKLLAQALRKNKTFDEIIKGFSPLLPRFYSIASSQAVVGQKAHLLVATFSYEEGGEVRQGIGSQFLCERAVVQHTPIRAYVQPTTHFTLPKEPTAPILMIGPGTGVAPYRGFLQQREHEKAQGENWLIFGERHRQCDYYYQPFLKRFKQSSVCGSIQRFPAISRRKSMYKTSFCARQSEYGSGYNGRMSTSTFVETNVTWQRESQKRFMPFSKGKED